MDDLGIAPLLDVVKVVKQLFNGSTSIEPHFAEWHQVIQDVESEVGSDNEQQHVDSPQIALHGKEMEDEKELKDDKKEERKERKEKEKEEKKERKKKQKEEKKKRKEEKKKQKVDDRRKKKQQKQLLKEAEKAKREGLTAALAFMHSRGTSKHSLKSWLVLTKHCRYPRIIPVRHRWGHWK
jgi:outer membrane biosynthesis protein TonB